MKQPIKQLLNRSTSRTNSVLSTVAQGVGVAVIALSLMLYLDILNITHSQSHERAVMVVSKPVSMVGSLFSKGRGFTKSDIAQLSSTEGVKSVGDFTSGAFRATASLELFADRELYTDIFFESIDAQYLDTIPAGWTFDPSERRLPIIIPQNYINLYNFGFAPTAGLPPLTREMLSSLKLRITIRNHEGERQTLEGYIAAYTSRLNTILAPEEFVRWGNELCGIEEEAQPQRVAIEYDQAQVGQVVEKVENQGFEIEGDTINFKRISQISTFALSALLVMGGVILLLSLLLLLLTINLAIERDRGKIEQLSILGFTERMITEPYTHSSIKIISICFAAGYTIALGARMLYLNALSTTLESSFELGSTLLWSSLLLLLLFATVTTLLQKIIRSHIKSTMI